jgi:hypothetical protein
MKYLIQQIKDRIVELKAKMIEVRDNPLLGRPIYNHYQGAKCEAIKLLELIESEQPDSEVVSHIIGNVHHIKETKSAEEFLKSKGVNPIEPIFWYGDGDYITLEEIMEQYANQLKQ